MTLDLAKSRRLDALNKRSEDRVLVKPSAHHSQVRLPDDGTVAAYLIDALARGCEAQQLAAETGWSQSTVIVNLYKVAKKCGVGIKRRNEILQLMMPQGSTKIYPQAKVVSGSATLRRMAEEVVLTPSRTH
jgi:hypothetical protein